MKIRRAKRSDLQELGRLYSDAYNDAGYKYSDEDCVKLIEKYFHIQKDLFFVVEDREIGIVGGIWGDIRYAEAGAYLEGVDIWVDPEYQKRGVGKQMLKHIIQKAVKRYKISFVEFLADKDKDFPMSYYKKLGFYESNWINMDGDPDEVLKKLK